MHTSNFQPAILAPLAAFGRSLTFQLRPGADPRAALARLQSSFDPAWGVLGLGAPLAQALDRDIPGLRPFPALAGPDAAAPSTQGALWCLIAGEDRSAVFDHAAALQALLAPDFTLADAQDCFRYREGRDLTGYEDGTENPAEEESPAVALVGGSAPMAGSSFVAVQRWAHDLQGFHAHSQQEQDNMIGRRLADNEELDDAPPSAHVKRSAQESFTPEAFMLRRSIPWTSGTAQGLEFIAYGHSLQAFEQVMRRMLGLEDGIVDALFRFSRPLTGGYYWCPALHEGRLDLRPLR